MNSSPAIRIGGKAGYCSGVLIAPDLQHATQARTRIALTCAHYFHADRTKAPVQGQAFHTHLEEVRTIPWTDIAVVRLAKECPMQELPAVSTRRAGWLTSTRTSGFGGSPGSHQVRPGRVIAKVPISLSRDLRTFVRAGAMLYNSPAAIRGDSGGPVISEEKVVGLQSLILDPFGHNLGIATVSQVAPHLRAIRKAIAELHPADS
ncbi:trypsin-like peptidase domain-containing protein [Corynebacterium sp. A21]|uniref:trypsin-like peptidase domain-containing protein n=1 Tax=Corynebacterium sp. A21 TaxID=3457318 RepID=UPI003FD0E185